MSAPLPTILFLLAIVAPSMLASVQQFQRRASLARLRAVLGVPGEGHSRRLAQALNWLGAKIPGGSDESLRLALMRAGYFQPSALHVFVVLRLVCAISALCAVLFQASDIGATTLIVAVFLAFFASRAFVIAIKLKSERRERLLRREIPPFIDILTMVLNSGISIDQSLRYVSDMLERTAPLCTMVLKRYVADVDSGVPFETAFERMGQRFGISEGHDFAQMVKQSLLQGGEIMASLDGFGSELADKRVAAAREQIGRKSVLLTLVMLAFFMPVLMITLGGPAVSQIMKTLNTAKHELHFREKR